MSDLKRPSGRLHNQLRDIKITYNAFGYAPGSVLFEQGNTKVLCSVSIQNSVPSFLRNKGTGWLTAEYAMLPMATPDRCQRDGSQMKKSDRSVEISRLIGRSLRSVVDVSKIGERTIYIDCDVLQADGSTRTACITGAYLALQAAVAQWVADGLVSESIITGKVAAVSAGCWQGLPILDLDYHEDSSIDADYNFVLTDRHEIIEIQGTAEKAPLSWKVFDQLRDLAIQGVEVLFATGERCPAPVPLASPSRVAASKPVRHAKPALFSLQNRVAAS